MFLSFMVGIPRCFPKANTSGLTPVFRVVHFWSKGKYLWISLSVFMKFWGLSARKRSFEERIRATLRGG